MADSPAKGAETPLWVATAPELARSNGKYFEKHKEGPSKFTDPAPIAALERALDSMVG